MKLNIKMDIIDYKKNKLNKEYWWFKGTRDLLDMLLYKNCNNKKNLRILDIGCGTGEDLEIINKFGRVTVLDISNEALKLIPNHLVERKILGDVQKLPDDLKNKFDIIIMFNVLEHVKDDNLAIDQCYKVLKKDGTLILEVPAISRMYSTHDKALGHHRRYNKKILFQKLNEKFRIKDIFYWNSILFLPIFSIRLLKKNSNKNDTDIDYLPRIINNLFYYIIKFENYLIKNDIYLPIGVSLVVVAKK